MKFPNLLLMLFFFSSSLLRAQDLKDREIRQFTTEDGLPSMIITTLMEGQDGFMWFGTEDGLSRFDGSRFVNYESDADDSLSLSGNIVTALAQRKDGKIWVGTTPSGLNLLEPKTGQVRRFETGPGFPSRIMTFLLDSKDRLWIGTWGEGVFRYDEKEDTFIHYKYRKKQLRGGNLENIVMVLSEAAPDSLLIGTFGIGILSLNAETGSINRELNFPSKVFSMQKSASETLLVGGGFFGSFEYKGRELLWNDTSTTQVRAVFEGEEGEIYLGGINGILVREQGKQKFVPLSDKKEVVISRIHKDKSGRVWVGSRREGIFLYYKNLLSKKLISNTLSFADRVIEATVNPRDNSVWMTGPGPEIMRISESGEVSKISYNIGGLNAFYIPKQGSSLWFGGLGAYLFEARPDGEVLNKYALVPPGSATLGQTNIVGIIRVTGNKMIIFSRAGAFWLDPEKKKVEPYKGFEQRFLCVAQSPDGRIFAGTRSDGLFVFDADGQFLYSENSVNSPMLSLKVLSGNRLAIGSQTMGLLVYNYESATFETTASSKKRFKSVLNIEEDNSGRLWLATDQGLFSYSRAKRFFREHKNMESEEDFNFDNKKSRLFKTPAGKFWYYSGNVVFRFSPDSIPTADQSLLSAKVSHFHLETVCKRFPKNYLPDPGEVITLKHDENSFLIGFTDFGFDKSDRRTYAYGFKEQGEQWITARKGEFEIRYNSLPPGTYTFRLKIRTAEGEWKIFDNLLKIKIIPPFWQTTGAIIFYTFLFFLFIWSVFVFRSRHLKQKAVRLEKIVSERNRELTEKYKELNSLLDRLQSTQSKLIESEKTAVLGLLTGGVAHEVNNPLTFINVSVELIKENLVYQKEAVERYEALRLEPDKEKQAGLTAELERFLSDNELDESFPESEEAIEIAVSGVKRLMEFVKNVQLFSRLSENESKKVKLSENMEAVLVLIRNRLMLNVDITTDYSPDLPAVDCFPGQINRVFLNLLLNAHESIEGQGEIIISIQLVDNQIVTKIADTGKGIPENEVGSLFEPFVTTKEGHAGIGLSSSREVAEAHDGSLTYAPRPGGGSVFELCLPVK